MNDKEQKTIETNGVRVPFIIPWGGGGYAWGDTHATAVDKLIHISCAHQRDHNGV